LDFSPIVRVVTKSSLDAEVQLILKGGQQGRVVLTHEE